MNDVTSFLAFTAAIFAAITVLLVLMSHLEARLLDRDAEDGPPREPRRCRRPTGKLGPVYARPTGGGDQGVE
jgi:hypothetical protein